MTFDADAVGGETKVRVLLPTDYSAKAAQHKRYPVLWLLHGGTMNYASWTTEGNAVEATAGLPLIVVMPDGGSTGEYADWYNFGDFGVPMFETYHMRQLLPWIDANFRTVADRSKRAIAGLSMGGFGSLVYAAKYPDLFGAIGSFSGDIDHNTLASQNANTIAGRSHGAMQPGATWGFYADQEVRWRGHNPWDLAANLMNADVSLYTRNGIPSEREMPPDPNAPAYVYLEPMVWEGSMSVRDRLTTLGIPVRWRDDGAGLHTWFYWRRDLTRWLPHAMEFFSQEREVPTSFRYASIAKQYRVYGWNVSIDRPALEFSELHVAGSKGFCLAGSGSATVVTGPLYRPDHRYEVVTTRAGRSKEYHVSADKHGRLVLSVALGSGNPHQQYTPLARTTAAAIGGAEGAACEVAGRAAFPSYVTGGSPVHVAAVAIRALAPTSVQNETASGERPTGHSLPETGRAVPINLLLAAIGLIVVARAAVRSARAAPRS